MPRQPAAAGLLLAVAFGLPVLPLAGQSVTPSGLDRGWEERLERVARLLDGHAARGWFAGVALVTVGDSVALEWGYGPARVAPDGAEVTPETPFPAGALLAAAGLEPSGSGVSDAPRPAPLATLLDGFRVRDVEGEAPPGPWLPAREVLARLAAAGPVPDTAVAAGGFGAASGRAVGGTAEYAVERTAEGTAAFLLLSHLHVDLQPLRDAVRRALEGEVAEPPPASIARRLLPVAEAAGAEAAIQRYRDLRRRSPEAYDFGAAELERLGGHLLAEGDTAAATAVLDFSVETFPEAFEAYRGAGRARLAEGDTAAAIGAWEAALERRPGAEEVLERLAGLGHVPDPALRLPEVEVPREVLRRYEGRYATGPGSHLEVRLEEDGLTVRLGPGEAFRLLPQAESRFLVHGTATWLLFRAPDGDGAPAPSVAVHRGEGRVVYEREGR